LFDRLEGLIACGPPTRSTGQEVIAVHSFAQIVRLRAEDDHVRLRFGDEQWTWAEVVQKAVDRAAALAMPCDKSRVATAGSEEG
jgi:hypothetical protein